MLLASVTHADMDAETAALPTVAKEWDAAVREVSEALPLREAPAQESEALPVV